MQTAPAFVPARPHPRATAQELSCLLRKRLFMRLPGPAAIGVPATRGPVLVCGSSILL